MSIRIQDFWFLAQGCGYTAILQIFGIAGFNEKGTVAEIKSGSAVEDAGRTKVSILPAYYMESTLEDIVDRRIRCIKEEICIL